MAAEPLMSASTMVPSVISADSIEAPSRETLALRRASARMPLAMLVALRLVKLAPLPAKAGAVWVPVKVLASSVA